MRKIITSVFILFLFFIFDACYKSHENGKEDNLSLFWAENLVPGYAQSIAGVEFNYHSPHPDVNSSLIVRATDGKMTMEWKTAVVPDNFSATEVTFIWIAGLGTHIGAKKFDLFVNTERWFTFETFPEKTWTLPGPYNSELSFKTTLVDVYDDHFGYMFLKVPASLVEGKNLTLKVVGEKAESNAWFMAFKEKLEPKVKLVSEQSLIRKEQQFWQNIRVELINLNKPMTVKLSALEKTIEKELNFGYNSITIPVEAIKKDKKINLRIDVEDKTAFKQTFTVNPVRKMEIHLLPHSHLDIGYTHDQDEVLKLQFQHLEKAMEYAEASQNFPVESQFKWNAEQMWHVEAYLKQSSPERQKKMIQAIKKGWIGLDALFANMLTGLCRPEELLQTTKAARDLKKQYGLNIESAMITDIPGQTWGLVPALALSGVKYLSLGPNSGHRVGHVYQWADQPFYWVSPSGAEKILCWVHGKGYSWFHTGLKFTLSRNIEDHKLKPDLILPYVESLVEANYPYDMIPIRYSIGADNGPPDPILSQVVKAWNEKYEFPRLVISTTAKFFSMFEKKFGGQLPKAQGDFTPYWEDGAASTARETAMNREAAERMVQASVLWTLLNPENYPAEDMDTAWKNVLLFDEHTWGAYNSISEPDAEFVKSQWDWKKNCAVQADRFSREILNGAVRKRQSTNLKITIIDVFNTNSWDRTDLVVLPKEMNLIGEKIQDENENGIPSQRLHSGELIFIAKDVPALGAKRFYFSGGSSAEMNNNHLKDHYLSNEYFTIMIDQKTGAISSIQLKESEDDLVDKIQLTGVNDYIYVKGRAPKNKKSIETPVKISIVDNGPVAAFLSVESEAPGCTKLSREISIYHGLDKIDIKNVLDRPLIRGPEGIHFGFPFQIPDGQIHVDSPFAIVRPELDQIKGACKNWFTVQHWIDISNENVGVTLATLDAPIMELGAIMADATYYGWVEKLMPTQTIYSYVMNNYWETNYKADQPGVTAFRYSIWPHRKYDPVKSQHFGIDSSQPLIAVPVGKDSPVVKPVLKIYPQDILVTFMKPVNAGKEILLRLFNTSDEEQELKFDWHKFQPVNIYVSNLLEEKVTKLQAGTKLNKYELVTLLIQLN